MTQPLVTIGLTCFNAEDTIKRAVSSALSQDWRNLEIVIVDDFSSDRSPQILEQFETKVDHVKIILNQKNMGPAGARNKILEEARGEFVVFFDDDDESLMNRVSCQVNTLVSYESRTGSNLVACYASGVRRYPNGYKIQLPAIGSRGKGIPKGPDIIDYLLLYQKRQELFYGAGVPACALMARRSTFMRVHGFDENLRRVEDVDFAIRLAHLGGHFVGTKEILYIQYATNAPDKSPENNFEAEQSIVKKNKEYLCSKGLYYYALHWPALRYWHFKRKYGRFTLELLKLLVRYPLRTTKHLISTGPKRILHEKRMRG